MKEIFNLTLAKSIIYLIVLYVSIWHESYAQSSALVQSNFHQTTATKINQEQELRFEENKGQIQGQDAQRVKFTLHSKGLFMFLLNDGITYQFSKTHHPADFKVPGKFDSHGELKREDALVENIRLETYRMDIKLEGTNPNPKITSEGRSNDYTQYYNQNVFDVHNYSKITYHEVYPGIDWVIYSKGNKIKYDFVVKPGGIPSKIRLKTQWVEDIQIGKDGSLELKNSMGSVIEKAPISYQNGRVINTQYKRSNESFQFDIAKYDKHEILIIDPSIGWSTYYGSTSDDYGNSCAVDGSGNSYLSGYTNSINTIASGGHQSTNGGGNNDAFLVKFNAAGTRVWATYYGGSGNDGSYSCNIDASDNVYLVGQTSSTNNISFNGHQNTIGGSTDAYLVKFNSAGIRQWATYYGGTDTDAGLDCSLDASGNVYLCGSTESANNIASGGHQNTKNWYSYVSFLVKFNANGVRQWGTYYGGAGFSQGRSCAVDLNGNIYLTGWTSSSTDVASGGYQNTYGGGNDAYLAKFNPAGVRQWGTYYGGTGLGSGDDYSDCCVIDNYGNIYLSGHTSSTNGIADGGYQNSLSNIGNVDAFLVKFDSTGQTRLWGTYYGGDESEYGRACSVNSFGNVFLVGITYSSNNISSGGYQNTFGGGAVDAFIVKFNETGIREWGSYFGDTGHDVGNDCAVDVNGFLFLAGQTQSTANIAVNGYQNVHGSSGLQGDAFLAKFTPDPPCGGTPFPGNTLASINPICIGDQVMLSLQYAIPGTGVTYQWFKNGIPINGANQSTHTTTITATTSFYCEVTCSGTATTNVSSPISITLAPNPTTVNLKFFIQGYYDVNSGSMRPTRMIQGCPAPNASNITTQVTVRLINAVSPYNIVATTLATVNTDGTCSATFPGCYSGQYYLNVTSCNTLGNCSAVPIVVGSNTANYDFTISAAQAYGANQVQVAPGIWAFISGDVNQDDNLNMLDIAQVQGDVFNYGCLCNDLDGDGNVGLSDLILITNNINNPIGGISCP